MSIIQFFNSLWLPEGNVKEVSNQRALTTKKNVFDAAKNTVVLVKDVWRHHFGIKLVDGMVEVGGEVEEKMVMVIKDLKIANKIVNLFEEWKSLEKISRRPERSHILQEKEEKFKEKLNLPLNILKVK